MASGRSTDTLKSYKRAHIRQEDSPIVFVFSELSRSNSIASTWRLAATTEHTLRSTKIPLQKSSASVSGSLIFSTRTLNIDRRKPRVASTSLSSRMDSMLNRALNIFKDHSSMRAKVYHSAPSQNRRDPPTLNNSEPTQRNRFGPLKRIRINTPESTLPEGGTN